MNSGGLTTLDLFSAMSGGEIEKLMSMCTRKEFFEGDILFVEHDYGEELYIVESGQIRISKAVSLSSDRTLGVVSRGGILGEMAVLEGANRSATAIAQTDGAVLSMDSEIFQKLVSEKPETGLKILRSLALTMVQRLRVTNDLLSDTVAWGLEVSGAAGLSFQKLMTESANIQLTLMNNREVLGQLVKVEKNTDGQTDLIVLDDDSKLHIVPYHAILEMTFESNIVSDQGRSEEENKRGSEDQVESATVEDAGESVDSEEESV